jgi:hypothetical protein
MKGASWRLPFTRRIIDDKDFFGDAHGRGRVRALIGEIRTRSRLAAKVQYGLEKLVAVLAGDRLTLTRESNGGGRAHARRFYRLGNP